MKIDTPSQLPIKSNPSYTGQVQSDKRTLENTADSTKQNASVSTNSAGNQVKPDAYISSEMNVKKAGYDNPVKKPDVATISRLKAESDRIFNSMREVVKQMLEKQGMTFNEVRTSDKASEITAETMGETSETSGADAASLIGEGGALSPEKLSDTLLQYAKALSGDDKSKVGLLRDAITQGFDEAKKLLGGKLPEISQKTYDLTMKKLDDWENGTSESA